MSKLTAYDKFVQMALKYAFSLFGLPPTGQKTSYASGDDGEYQKGYPRKGSRFTDNGDGTVTDNATGLTWEQVPGAGLLSWSDALAYAASLSLGGHDDWRMPNIKELVSISDFGTSSPSQDTTYFPIGVYPYFWSSTTAYTDTAKAWITYYDNAFIYIKDKLEPHNLRCVRGGFPA